MAVGAGVMRMFASRPAGAQDETNALTRRIQSDLERHAAFGDKFSGSPGDIQTAGWIAERLRRSGYQVARSTFDAPFFVQREARLTAGASSATVMPQAPVVTTGRQGVTARLGLVEGDVGDVRGRIVVFVAPFARHAALFPTRGIGLTVTQAAAAGASAIVIVTTGPTGEAVALNAPEQPFVPVPAVILAPKDAAPFVDAARSGADATLVLDGDATHRPSPNLVGRLERGPRWLVFSTPRSGWFGCAGERGTGTAAFLELADWAVRRFPDLSIFVMNSGGHEYFFAGSHRILDQAPAPAATLAWTHVGASIATRDADDRRRPPLMLDTADPQRTLMVTDTAREAATEAFRGLAGLERPVGVRPGAGELSAFTDRGYTTAFAVLGVHRWLHTPLDTLERVDARLVVPVLRAHQRTVERIVSRA